MKSTETGLRTHLHDRLYLLGMSNLKLRQQAVEILLLGGVLIIKDYPEMIAYRAFTPDTPLQEALSKL